MAALSVDSVDLEILVSLYFVMFQRFSLIISDCDFDIADLDKRTHCERLFLLALCFFLDTNERKRSCQVALQRNYRGSCANRSASPGAVPPVWHQVSHHLDGSTREAAKATAHVVASMRVQRRSQAHETWRDMYRGTSRARARASCRTMCTASSLHRPPVSMARTTNRHRSDAASSK